VKDFSITIMRGDRIGLIGPNGTGKTTLLKILLGQLTPDHGKVKIGTRIEIAYFDQLREQLELEKKPFRITSPMVEILSPLMVAMSMSSVTCRISCLHLTASASR